MPRIVVIVLGRLQSSCDILYQTILNTPMPRSTHPTVDARQIPGKDLALPLVVALGTVHSRGAERVVWHTHAPHELLFVLEGATTYEFYPDRMVELTGGHFLFVPAGSQHRGGQDVRSPSVLCGIQFDARRRDAGRNSVLSGEDLQALLAELNGVPPTVRPFNRELRRLIPRMMEECQAFNAGRGDFATKASLRALACLAIVEAVRQLTSLGRTDPMEMVAAAEAYLQEHFAEPLQMSDLARHLGLSRARMFEIFKQATGLTPNDYLVRRRIQQARELIEGTERSITDIALASGFSSSQYFSHVFRKYVGMTPSECRRRGAAAAYVAVPT
jgi:AraC-like DNA-binding protein/quercetin dioxygenase-like cupin family protein